MAIAGLDVGTSGCKVCVYRPNGTLLWKGERRYEEQGGGGRRELNPATVMEEITSLLQEMGGQCGAEIEALAVTSLGESVVCLDENDAPLAPSPVTGDDRGGEQLRRLVDTVGEEKLLHITGLPPSELYGLPKYMWLNENTTAIKNAAAILFYEDLVGYLLTGQRMVSHSSAARSMALNIQSKQWDETLLGFAGIRKQQMSTPVPSGTVIGTILPHMAQALALNPAMVVVTGGHDQSCAALGSGMLQPHTAECGMGTCEFMFIMLPQKPANTHARMMIDNDLTCVPYVLGGTYLTSLEVTTCGILNNWMRDTLLRGVDLDCQAAGGNYYNYLEENIKGLHTDVMLLPQFGSSGNPNINFGVSGTITGLTVHTKPQELYLAMLEGLSFQMLLSYRRALPLGVDIRHLVATGGLSGSQGALQTRADMFGIDVSTIQSKESGTLGCMLLAATALGKYPNISTAVTQAVHIQKTYKPNPRQHAYYQQKFAKYEALYNAMHLF